MKKFSVFCMVLCTCFSGCRVSENKGIVIQGDCAFPSEIVGTWKESTENGWQLKIDANGNIEEIVWSLGRFHVERGQKSTIPMQLNKISTVEPGDWVTYYDCMIGDFTFEININNFHAELADNVIEGNSREIITGRIDQQGDLVADWTFVRKAVAYTEQYPKGFDMSQNESEAYAVRLIFEKVLEKESSQK